MRNRRGEGRDWLRGDVFEAGLRRLADRLPLLWNGTILDGGLIAGAFRGRWPRWSVPGSDVASCGSRPSTCRSWPASTYGRCPGRPAGSGSTCSLRRSRRPSSCRRWSTPIRPWPQRSPKGASRDLWSGIETPSSVTAPGSAGSRQGSELVPAGGVAVRSTLGGLEFVHAGVEASDHAVAFAARLEFADDALGDHEGGVHPGVPRVVCLE